MSMTTDNPAPIYRPPPSLAPVFPHSTFIVMDTPITQPPCPTPEADTLVDVGVRLLGAIERLVATLHGIAEAEYGEWVEDES